MLLDGAFTFLLLASGVFTVSVPRPTNVTVSCQNLKATVRWDYSKHQPRTNFSVNIKASTSLEPYEDFTTDHEYDLSEFVWKSQEHYLALLFVTVTAIQGGNKSEAVQSKTFSFNSLKTVDIRCVLEFPRVELHVDETRASVRFQNPVKINSELKQAGDSNDVSVLEFKVLSPAGDFEGSCKAEADFCKKDVTLPKHVEKCVTLTGVLYDRNGINQVSFKETGRICDSTDGSSVGESLLAGVLVSIFVTVICVAVFTICKMKAWTMNAPNPPKFLQVPPEDDLGPSPSEDRAEMSPVFITSMISNEQRTVEDSADDSLKTETLSLSSQDEQQEMSPYDCRHFLEMDMGDGEMITGY